MVTPSHHPFLEGTNQNIYNAESKGRKTLDSSESKANMEERCLYKAR